MPDRDDLSNTGIKPLVIAEIQEYARRFGLERVTLFGSRARGDYRPKSDIDLALSGGDQVRFALEVDDEVSTLLRFDLVNLDGPLSAELRSQIGKDGRPLYEKVR